MNTVCPTIDAATVARWRDNACTLRRLLAQHPDHDWAWLWRVRLRVADYLIHRYVHGEPGSEHFIDARRANPSPGPSPASPTDYTARRPPGDLGSSSRYAWLDTDRLQTHLHNIADANAPRRKEIEIEWRYTLRLMEYLRGERAISESSLAQIESELGLGGMIDFSQEPFDLEAIAQHLRDRQ